MRSYEVVFIVHPDLDEAAVNETVEKVKGWITAGGGTVEKVDFWGKRQLAYPIRKRREGYYILLETQMPPTLVAQLERNMRLHEPVMRYLITRTDA
ncbi:MAG TPA: 30S ribosomal protein S6 [Anaerolineae bacterium]|nr:30S ribosomal protein S6 [Anaerolineae bacterium]HID85570.1 30S ribosomal protein S6 [Anaerolineales bacterium]HIQ07946.1 30S ribosomal protein S6 [Anaerolineaceae bacterium]